jgi:hypothetical protein
MRAARARRCVDRLLEIHARAVNASEALGGRRRGQEEGRTKR